MECDSARRRCLALPEGSQIAQENIHICERLSHEGAVSRSGNKGSRSGVSRVQQEAFLTRDLARIESMKISGLLANHRGKIESTEVLT